MPEAPFAWARHYESGKGGSTAKMQVLLQKFPKTIAEISKAEVRSQ